MSWTDRDPILFALALGASPDQLDLVFEEQLRVIPTFAITLTQWAPDVLGAAGAFDVSTAVHGSQSLRVRKPLPRAGEITMTARVTGVWDKGTAAVYDVAIESDFFTTTWSLFAPDRGGFGGDRGAPRPAVHGEAPTWRRELPIASNAAALYRLLGDRHRIHIDPVAAARIGQPRPILHGLATLSSSVLAVAQQQGHHPADLTYLRGRFAAPVIPGEVVEVCGWEGGQFGVVAPGGTAISDGLVEFG